MYLVTYERAFTQMHSVCLERYTIGHMVTPEEENRVAGGGAGGRAGDQRGGRLSFHQINTFGRMWHSFHSHNRPIQKDEMLHSRGTKRGDWKGVVPPLTAPPPPPTLVPFPCLRGKQA